jgi:tryptophan-rich sensory protein
MKILKKNNLNSIVTIMHTWLAYLIATLAIVAVAYIPSRQTSKQTDSPWYKCIRPSITPPNIVFPIVWTILYALIAYVLANVLLMPNGSTRSKLVSLIAINLTLNVFWTFAYFGHQNVGIALLVIVSLVATNLSIASMLWKTPLYYPFLPYVLWVMFATLLNGLSMLNVQNCKSLLGSQQKQITTDQNT